MDKLIAEGRTGAESGAGTATENGPRSSSWMRLDARRYGTIATLEASMPTVEKVGCIEIIGLRAFGVRAVCRNMASSFGARMKIR